MRLGLALALTVLALSACGGGDAPAGSESGEESESLPTCAEVWVDGETLPADYEGCVREDGDIEAAVVYDCDSGAGRFTSYDDRFHALLGEEIVEAGSDSKEYGEAYEACFAG